jgi:hypothetical protein
VAHERTEPAPPDPVIAAQADEVVTKLLTVGRSGQGVRNKQAIENLGGDLQREAARRSAMLKQPARCTRAQPMAAKSPMHSPI